MYHELLPLVYVRYVDDVGTVVKNRQEAENTLKYLNSKYPTIKFEMELPSEAGFLPLLDMAVRIDETFPEKTFHKKSKQGNCFKLLFSTTRMTTKLQNNGYPRDWIMHSLLPDQRKRGRPTKAREKPDLTLRLPFISDEFNRGARQLLEKYNIAADLLTNAAQRNRI